MKDLIGKHVLIKGRDENDPDSEGRVDDQVGDTVYITNLNMPYCGTMVLVPFDIKDIIVAEDPRTEFKHETKEQLLLRRVFKLIYMSHFTDHKMIRDYIEKISFDRQLGEEIANYIHSKYPEYYHRKRKEVERMK